MHIDVKSECEVETSNIYNFSDDEYFQKNTLLELSRCSWSSNDKQYFLKGCKWSPDGTCCLTCVNNDGMQLFELPYELYNAKEISDDRPVDIIQPVIEKAEEGSIYDFAWYPLMNGMVPESCCWISSRQHSPIQMWSAIDGTLKCSYRGYDNVDELESAISLTFSYDGSKIYGGYRKSIKIFTTEIPGRDYAEVTHKSGASALALNSSSSVLAVGSWNSSLSLFDIERDCESICKVVHHTGGITNLQFSLDGSYLISGSRKDNTLHYWDVRDMTEPLYSMNRIADTNQRIYFSLSRENNWLISGDTRGIVHLWKLNDTNALIEKKFQLHHDCCNGISVHNQLPIIATSSGQFHFEDEEQDSMSKRENSLNFWWYGSMRIEEEDKS